ncbi:hypothetical protein ACFRAE_07555 [Sphingobacterium sp. HJSM2_6]|uniref:hypothetical protein n=1 Tax=Sphingobacterium sp. HJSM2_6 TaxID=3366264 RepID=UPI003BD9DDFE
MENNYQLSRIHNYVMGLMTKEEMYDMEREALNDPFLQDAIDGYRMQNGVDTNKLSLLQQRLATKLQHKEQEKKQRFYSWQRLTVAMAAAVLFLVACSLILFNYFNLRTTDKNTEVILMEEHLRIRTEVKSSTLANPMGGWEQFNEELNSELRDVRQTGIVDLSFRIENTVAKDIQILQSSDKKLGEIVSQFVAQKVRWQGESLHISIEVGK